ncbi:MAG: hypothetical protein JWN76_2422 [Chitinophagaceae bacterium]|nr:hypothetical protein [Chitinophagaceae bacterium]
MKSFFLGLALIITIGAFAQSPIKFDKTKHSFGKIKQGKPVTTIFKLTNTSAKPVVIENAVAGCGCTTPEYQKTPILKGQTSNIKVTYNAATVGPFTKTVTVKLANVAEPVVLNIEGEVLAPAVAKH